VSETIQLEEPVQLHEAPKLLVEWSERWPEFVSAIRPAFARSGTRLAGESAHGLVPYRGMLTVWAVEAFLLFVIIVLPRQIASMRPYAAPKVQPYEVIYYSGDELPRTEDLGGAHTGASGRAGGREAHHRTQTIRVARGRSLAQKIVDAPNLKLPASTDAVANLLAIKPTNPGPPPSEGLHSSLVLPSLPANVVAPAPANVAPDHSRGGVTLDAVVPPAPSLSRDRSLVAPSLNSTVVAPAPNVSREHSLIAPSLNANVIAPAPTNVSRDRERSAPALNGSVIPPAPGVTNREISRSPVQMSSAVVPPPVSAPEREQARNPKLSLPSPSVIAPPPSADSSRDLRTLASGSVADPSRSVVPPPPTPTGSSSFMSSIIGKIFGTQDVVPPPPTVSAGNASGSSRNAAGSGVSSNVIPPPPSVGGSATGAGGTASGRGRTNSLGAANVVPPPPSVSGSGSSRGAGGASGAPGGSGLSSNELASNVIQPPPSLGSGSGASGSGLGRKGTGLGGVGEVGSVLAPPNGGGGSGSGSGVVVSNQPGSKVGIPGNSGAGSLALSPAGEDHPGLGGAGGGSGIGHGDGPGSGMTGTESGAGKSGSDRGSDPNARGGISPSSGPGGAGNAPVGIPVVPGVSVSGGSTIITLPSFGSDANGNDPNLPGRSSVKEQQGPAITIVATSRSGGAFNFYGELKGDRVYTIYLDTSLGQAVMQFADPASAAHPYAENLVDPQPMRTDLPRDLMNSHMVLVCTLDTSGNLKNFKVLEPGPAVFTAKVMAALPSWKFRPAMRGKQPVEVTAILGFGINTDDRH